MHNNALIAAVLLSAATAIAAWFWQGTFWGNFLLGVTASTVSAFFVGAVVWARALGSDVHRILLFFHALLHRRRKVRFSFAYLYRIKIDDKFLLIHNLVRGHVAPVGGAYKHYKSALPMLEKLGCTPCIGTDRSMSMKFKHDLRMLTSLGNAQAVIRWFLSGSLREYAPNREFAEELIDDGLLPSTLSFADIEYSKFASHTQLTRFDASTQYYTFRHFDIFSLALTQEQKALVLQAVRENEKAANGDPTDQRLFLATRDEIEGRRLKNGRIIGGNAVYIL